MKSESGPKLSGNISGTDPLKDNRLLLKAQPLDNTEEAKHTAKEKNIANIVLLRGCGIRIEVPAFKKNHGLRPCMVAPTKIIAGLDEHKPGVSDGYDFGFLHIKVIDDACHDKASVFKVKGLEAVDKAIGQLARLLWEAESTVSGESIVLQTSLDSFPLPTVEAGDDLSAYVAAEEEISQTGQAFSGDSVWRLNEIVAARGCLGRFPGSEMMGIIKKFIQLEL
ncbi:hypothetical protein L1987_61179 [Smallanthus sonchifolius]|uniref:Uncharacterized protein n=1 Tax=Smallanthus sonchifolius TaxID=185202 RepID=A0ACB9DAG3_9ASTR|nr:hypothetical protein L1987_61179 [Smallanthus sonchifolius]